MRRGRELAGQVALVTGAGRGIGRAICGALLREGVVVAGADLDPGLRPAPGVRAYALDVADLDAFRGVVEGVERDCGPLDILINNAGIMSVGPLLEQDPATDRRQVDVNLFGVLHGMRAALPGMRRRGRGHVVNLASVAGKVGVGHIAVYSATKHAVVGLTEAARDELRGEGIDFSYVLPAFVETELIAGTRRPRWPRPVGPDVVAEGVIAALRTGRVEVYVPRAARLGSILPAVLPRRVREVIGTALGLDGLFSQVDPAARATYQARLGGGGR